MQTSAPAQKFLQAVDKFVDAFFPEDPKLSAGAGLLYLKLFLLAGRRDACTLSQTALARACKISQRAVRLYLRQLASLGYIRIERDGVYRLPFSARLHELAAQAGGAQ